MFLDFDGVLNSQDFYVARAAKRGPLPISAPHNRYDDFDPEACARLRRIMNAVPEVDIVISSTWRINTPVSDLRGFLSAFGIDPRRVIDKTPHFPGKERGEEVAAWLAYRPDPDTAFVILDDDHDMGALMPHLVKTDNHKGLTDADADEVIRRLSGQAIISSQPQQERNRRP